MKHWPTLFFLLLIIPVSSIMAQTIEVVATEDARLSSEKTLGLSEFIVSGCLDSLFDSGFIGTNKRAQAGTLAGFEATMPQSDSRESFIDYQLLVYLVYANGEVLLPPNAVFKLVRVADLVILGEGTLASLPAASQASVDIENACSAMGKSIVLTSLVWLKE